MKRLVACLVLSFVWSGAAPGRAQGVRSIEGGGSFFQATAVEQGRYRDTILPGETSFYAVELGVGQVLRVEARMEAEPGVDRKNILPAYPKLTLYAPDRSERSFEQETWIVQIDSRKMKVRSRRVGAGDWTPGTYFFTVTLGDQAATLKRREYDVRFKVQIRGRAQPAPTPTPSPSLIAATPTPTPTATPTEVVSSPASPDLPPADGGDSSIPWFVGSFVAGAVVGASGRFLLTRRER